MARTLSLIFVFRVQFAELVLKFRKLAFKIRQLRVLLADIEALAFTDSVRRATRCESERSDSDELLSPMTLSERLLSFESTSSFQDSADSLCSWIF